MCVVVTRNPDTCIYGTSDIYSKAACDVYGAPGSITSLAAGNTFMTPGAQATIQCPMHEMADMPGRGSGSSPMGTVCSIPQHHNIRIDGDDILPKRSAPTADGCCALCATVKSCKAFLWVKPTTCWLKTAAHGARHDPGCVAGATNFSPSPVPPHPAGGIRNMSLAEYTARTNRDVDSVVKEMPSTAQIVDMAKALLNL